jgi:hypothetical protein
MGTVKYTDDCATISSAVLSEVLRYAQVEASPPVTHYCNLNRILSTAGFVTTPEGAAEAVQGIFVDTEVARVV